MNEEESEVSGSAPENTLWSASDRGDTARVKELLATGKDVNQRNCLGCTPLLYACGSGHYETVRIDLNMWTVSYTSLTWATPVAVDITKW